MSFHGLIAHFCLALINKYSIVLIHQINVCSPTKVHLGYLQVLEIVNKMIINIHMQVFVCTLVFNSFEQTPRSAAAGSYGQSMFSVVKVKVKSLSRV